MSPLSWIAFWAVLFIVTHLATTGASIRPRIVRAIGETPYRGLYSLISFATFIPLVEEYFSQKHAGAMLWWLRDDAAVRFLAIALVLVSILMIVAGVITPSPTALMSHDKVTPPRGILKLTRHPAFVGIATFALAHMLMNGSTGDLMFFGSLVIVAVAGCAHQDSRKLHDLGEPYRHFVAQTSAIPGAALLSGRQKLTRSDLSPISLAVGVALFAALVIAHPYIFGGNPLRALGSGSANVTAMR